MDLQFDNTSIGITSTVPVEVIFAAGLRPVDLNNRFITAPDPKTLISDAESAGFPINMCAWIKGIYSFVRSSGISRVIGVTQGDCSNTHLLMEILEEEGIEVISFEYPRDRDPARLRAAVDSLARRLGTTLSASEDIRRRLAPLRSKLARLDDLTWRDGTVSGWQNHLWLINSSDFRGDWLSYEAELDSFLAEAALRKPRAPRLRLGFIGIPPIVCDLYERLDSLGAAVVFNEFQRQFAMLGPFDSLAEQYLAYTYPYATGMRIADITAEASRRNLDGLVHYIQSFCYRQLQDRMIRRACDVPVLSLEFDRPGPLDARSLTRIEAFVELLDGRLASSGRESQGSL